MRGGGDKDQGDRVPAGREPWGEGKQQGPWAQAASPSGRRRGAERWQNKEQRDLRGQRGDVRGPDREGSEQASRSLAQRDPGHPSSDMGSRCTPTAPAAQAWPQGPAAGLLPASPALPALLPMPPCSWA